MSMLKKTFYVIISVILILALCSGVFFVVRALDPRASDPTIRIYGVKGFGGSSPTLTRVYDSEGLTVYKDTVYREYDVTGYISDFDEVYPYSEMEEVRDEYGNYFIIIPEFYYKISSDEILICREKVPSLGIINHSPLMYVGSYLTSDTFRMVSKPSAQYSVVNSLNLFREACVGDGYYLFDYDALIAINILFTVEFATTDSESIFTSPSSKMPSDDKDGFKRTIIKGDSYTGDYSSEFGKFYGFKYRGIENYFGYWFTFVDGVRFDSSNNAFFAEDPSQYSELFSTAESDLKSKYTYMSHVMYSEGFSYLARSENGRIMLNGGFDAYTSSTYLCDYVYPGKGGDCLYFGGSYGDCRDGIWSWYRNTSSDETTLFISARLCYRPTEVAA